MLTIDLVNLDLLMTFGEALKAQMQTRGVKAADLARKAGITKQGIGRLINNVPHPLSGAPPKPELETVEKIALALDWDINEARLAAGFAPTTTRRQATTVRELLDDLWEIGIQINLSDNLVSDSGPEAFERAKASITAILRAQFGDFSEPNNDENE